MFALAVVFLTGALGLIGWMFRGQIMPLVQMALPSVVSPEETEVASEPTQPEPDPSAPRVADSESVSASRENAMDLEPPSPTLSPSTTASTSTFDPTEPAPLRALPASPDEIASVQEAPPQMGMTGSVALPPLEDSGPKDLPFTPDTKTREESLLEVPPSDTGLTGATAERNLSSQSQGPFTNIKDLEPEALPAAEALQKFLSAADVNERLKYTLGADAMAPLMERYYSRTPDGPVIVDTVQIVRYDPKPQVGDGAHAVFGLGSQTWEFPVPVMLEETKDGWKVDWLAFVEFKDRLLEKFLESYQEGPARFHVGISRTHFFDDTVPNADNRHAFRVGPAPPNPFLKTVFLPKESTLSAKLKDSISWGAQVWAIVELQWRRMGGDQWVELVAVPQLNWYSVPTVQAASAPIPQTDTSAPLDTVQPAEIPKGLPVGR